MLHLAKDEEIKAIMEKMPLYHDMPAMTAAYGNTLLADVQKLRETQEMSLWVPDTTWQSVAALIHAALLDGVSLHVSLCEDVDVEGKYECVLNVCMSKDDQWSARVAHNGRIDYGLIAGDPRWPNRLTMLCNRLMNSTETPYEADPSDGPR